MVLTEGQTEEHFISSRVAISTNHVKILEFITSSLVLPSVRTQTFIVEPDNTVSHSLEKAKNVHQNLSKVARSFLCWNIWETSIVSRPLPLNPSQKSQGWQMWNKEGKIFFFLIVWAQLNYVLSYSHETESSIYLLKRSEMFSEGHQELGVTPLWQSFTVFFAPLKHNFNIFDCYWLNVMHCWGIIQCRTSINLLKSGVFSVSFKRSVHCKINKLL